MSNKKYDTLVFLCRVQPVHNAHAEIIKRATRLAKQLIIIVGSAKQPRTYKNPWSSKERRMMLENVCDEMHLEPTECSIRIEENTDTIYNDQAWAARVQAIVGKHTQPRDNIAIIGHKKDGTTSAYLDMFPQWGFAPVELIEPLHATDIRDLYFRDDVNLRFIEGVVPFAVMRMLRGWECSPEREQVIRERAFIIKHNLQYASLAYPPIFSTADSVVVCAGHVLMITRRAEPGKNLLALPGGYVNANTDKSVMDAAIRELREETMIKVPDPVLRGSIVKSKVYDAIGRSPRGRIITHAFLIRLPDGELPRVKGGDDALKARWIPLAELDSEKTFEDHYEIIQDLIGF
jgi:bifunctional NMN adenylyltransferase/nudix hydrolase